VGGLQLGALHVSWSEAGVANDDFLVHASRPLIEAGAGRLGGWR
jgi:hypothetical protein